MRGWWRKAFREEYSPFFEKTVKGYRFVCANWDTGTPDDLAGDNGRPFARIAGWLAASGSTLDPSKPFFYIQHPHPKDTCHGPNVYSPHSAGLRRRVRRPSRLARRSASIESLPRRAAASRPTG